MLEPFYLDSKFCSILAVGSGAGHLTNILPQPSHQFNGEYKNNGKYVILPG